MRASGSFYAPTPARQFRIVYDQDSIEGGSELPPGADPRLAWTLPEFFWEWVVPGLMRSRDQETIHRHRDSLKFWAAIAGEKTLFELSDPRDGDAIGMNFTDELPEWGYSRRGKKLRDPCLIGSLAEHPSYTPLQPITAATHAQRISQIIRYAGPRYHPRKPTAEILTRPPLIPTMTADFITKPPFELAQARAIAAACVQMVKPNLPPGWSPVLWWQTRIAIYFYTGMRSGTVLALRRAHITSVDGLVSLKVPGTLTKTGKPVNMLLHPQLAALIERLPPTGDGLLLPEGCNYRHFLTLHERLQQLAGLPPAEWKSPHAWRRTHAVQMEGLGLPEAQERSRLALDHGHQRTTHKSYTGDVVVNQLRLMLPPIF